MSLVMTTFGAVVRPHISGEHPARELAGCALAGCELDGRPEFEIGSKVRCRFRIRNDGTYPGRRIGEVLISQGEIGYVQAVGTFLQRYYIYSVDFFERGMIVGMRGHEIELAEFIQAIGDDDEDHAAPDA